MTDEKKYTERDLILAKREGFRNGVEELWGGRPFQWKGIDHEANERYPLPKVTRPRVVRRADGCELRISGTELQYRWHSNEWQRYNGMCIDENNRPALLDLLANPTEEVEA